MRMNVVDSQISQPKAVRGLCVTMCAALLSVFAQAQTPTSQSAVDSADSVQTAPLQEALFVTDEWHELTRQDGSGLYFDLVKAVFERQGVQVTYRIFPYARAVQKVKDEEADGWIASFWQEQPFPLYPLYHFDKNEQIIVYRKGSKPEPVTTASLHGQRVAWLRGFGLDRFIHAPMHVTEVDAIDSAFQMLTHNRIDYFVGARSDIEDFMARSGVLSQDFGKAYALHLKLYMAFANTAKGAKLRAMWDTEMASFHKTDAFKAIYRKYGYAYPFP